MFGAMLWWASLWVCLFVHLLARATPHSEFAPARKHAHGRASNVNQHESWPEWQGKMEVMCACEPYFPL